MFLPPQSAGLRTLKRHQPGLAHGTCWVALSQHTKGSLLLPVQAAKKASSTSSQKQNDTVTYGSDWYERTKPQKGGRSVREELEYRRAANLAANRGKERKDLYTDAWDGSEYKGSNFNVLTIILVVSVLVPFAGLIFAYQTYGTLWG